MHCFLEYPKKQCKIIKMLHNFSKNFYALLLLCSILKDRVSARSFKILISANSVAWIPFRGAHSVPATPSLSRVGSEAKFGSLFVKQNRVHKNSIN